MARLKNIGLFLVSTMVVTIILIIIGELVFFIFPLDKAQKPPYDTAEKDETLGWKAKGNYHFEGSMYTLDKTPYDIHISTTPNGFRQFPEKTDSLARIFFIGDSYTQAIEVSDGHTFYSFLGENLHAEMYAYGMAGYGTLQEEMILDQYLKTIDPEIVVLQVCANDFLDNDFQLEQNAIYRVGQRRPYLKEGSNEIVYANPLRGYQALIYKTNFVKFCYKKWDRLKFKFGIHPKNNSEKKIGESGLNFAPYARSVETTSRLIRRIQGKVGENRTLIIYSADAFEPQQQDFETICQENGIRFIRFPAKEMEEERARHEVYSEDGYHWTEHGHRVIAKHLEPVLREVIE